MRDRLRPYGGKLDGYAKLGGGAVVGFSLVADGAGYVPAMSAEQSAAVQAVLDQYAPNNRTVGFAIVDLRTGSGYAYNVDADVYGASTFKGHVAVFACQQQIEGGVISQSSIRSNTESTIIWSDNNSYFRLRNSSGAGGSAMRSWLSGMGLDPSLGQESFPTYSVRESMQLWMNNYLYLKSGDAELTSWLAGLFSDTEVSMIRSGVSGGMRLDPGVPAEAFVAGLVDALCESFLDDVLSADALEEIEEAGKTAGKGASSNMGADGSAVVGGGSAGSTAGVPGAFDASGESPEEVADAVGAYLAEVAAFVSQPEGITAGAANYLGFGLDASGDATPEIVVYNKAGWINGNNYDAVCDAGIIAEGDEAYLMSIMTSAPDSTGNRQLVSDLASALWAARETLQPEGLVKA